MFSCWLFFFMCFTASDCWSSHLLSCLWMVQDRSSSWLYLSLRLVLPSCLLCISLRPLPCSFSMEFTIASWEKIITSGLKILLKVELFLQLRNALQKCSVLIIPMGTRSSAITQRNASLLLKPLKPPHMNRPSELNTLLICENMYGDLCRIVWAVSVGELNVMLVSCCNSMWIATYQQ